MPRRLASLLWLFLAFLAAAQAHIGSSDIYLDGKAGAYQVFVTVRPPTVIPGIAELEVRSATPGIRSMDAVPLPMSGQGAEFAPVADQLKASAQDAQLFSGSLWMMEPGSWQVRITIDGVAGRGVIAIPVPSAALTTKRMQLGLGAILAGLSLFLIGGLVVMVGASVREARLEPGVPPDRNRVRAGHTAMAITLLVVMLVLWGGNRWWNSDAASYEADVYKPLHMQAAVAPAGILTLNLTDPGWLKVRKWRPIFSRSVDDFVPDHNHPMHLYVIRQPGLDLVYHLHPDLAGSGLFRLALPSMPAGKYNLYADVVHANGFPETLVSTLDLSAPLKGRALAGDDAEGSAEAWGRFSGTTTRFTLPDGYRMIWNAPGGELRARQPALFRFSLVKPDGSKPSDMAFYMGMLGHAAFVKTDGTVFAHIHPTGSVPMAAFLLAQRNTGGGSEEAAMPGMDMSGGRHGATAALPNDVGFPYGFPKPGHYRIFVQMKHGVTIEMGIFDAKVI